MYHATCTCSYNVGSDFGTHSINAVEVYIHSDMHDNHTMYNVTFFSDAKYWLNINEGDMPPCQRMPCKNNGVCVPREDNIHDYSCNCTAGFSGKNCETHIACQSENCNGGECIPKDTNPQDFVCLCPLGRVGVQCQTGECTT